MCLKMNRETCKANLRKLKLPGTSTVRNTRNSRTATTSAISSPSVSNYFAVSKESYTIENSSKENNESPANPAILLDNPVETQDVVETNLPPKRSKRTKLTSFLNGKGALPAAADDFATPAKQVKKAPRIKRSNATAKNKSNKARSSHQPNIKSAFLRNEQMFAEITAQHCIADNIDPDDMQLALAISKSQAEAESKVHNEYPIETEEDVIIDLMAEDCIHNTATVMDESIRTKLQKYGFRTTQRADYGNYAAMYASKPNQRRNKCKWANKFTALTLRQSEIQAQKLQQKVDAFLSRQCTTESSEAVDQQIQSYNGFSTLIKAALCINNNIEIVKRTDESVAKYFVENLFEVRNLKAGHLLKDWSAIQGRDKSPTRQKGISNNVDDKIQELQRIYKELENFYNKPQCNENEETCENIVETSKTNINQVELKETDVPDDCIQLKDSPTEDIEIKSNNELNSDLITDDWVMIENKEIPSTYRDSKSNSPDIFADSDIEMEAPEAELESAITTNFTTNHKFSPIKDFHDTDVNATQSPKGNLQLVDKLSMSSHRRNDVTSEMSSNVIDLTCSDEEDIEVQEIISVNRNSDVEMHSPDMNKEVKCNSSLKHVSNSLHSSPTSVLSTQHELSSMNVIDYLSPKKVANSPIFEATIRFDSPQSTHEFSFLDLIQDDDSSSPKKNITSSPQKKLTTSLSFDTLPYHKSVSPTSNQFIYEEFNHMNSSRLKKAFVSLSQDFRRSSPLSTKETSISSLRHHPNDSTAQHEYSFVDNIKPNTSTISKSYSSNSFDFTRPPTESLPKALSSWSAERAEYGILESHSEPLTQSPSDWVTSPMSRSPTPESTTPMKLYGNRSISQKFAQLIQAVTADSNSNVNEQMDESFDEFDKLTYGSPIRTTTTTEAKPPSGLNELLTAELSFESCRPSVDLKTPEKTKYRSDAKDLSSQQLNGASEEMLVNGRKYTIRGTNTPKPDFTKQSMSELERQLYKFGIKAMSRKSAVKILEYIYNQTHPIVESDEMKSPPITNDSDIPNSPPSAINNCKTYVIEGINMLLSKYLQITTPKLCANEDYILPKRGPTKQRPGPVIPLHIAWHNLIGSNVSLYESVLSYEPIDIQKVAGSFKCLGLSYEKMQLERFLNGRCVIYRNENEQTSNRHVRKGKK